MSESHLRDRDEMKAKMQFGEFLSKIIADDTLEEKTDYDDLSNVVHNSVNFDKDGYKDSIGVFQQRDAKSDQQMFKVDSFDENEFGVKMKPNETLVRVSTPISKPTNTLNRYIAKINLVKGTIAFIDNDKYENDMKVVWGRGRKCKFMTMDFSKDGDYFDVG